jgi:hypothetical protein
MKHLRALVFEKRIKETWSHYLPLVQRIMNYTVHGSIGTQPAKVVLGDISSSDVAMDVPESCRDHNVIHYLVKLREAQAILIRVTQDYIKRNEVEDNTVHNTNESEYTVGQFVLLQS